MKIFKYFNFIILLISVTAIKTEKGYDIILKNDKSTIDGHLITTIPTFGVSYINKILSITQKGIYVLSGTLDGQIRINTNETVILVLYEAFINSPYSTAIVFENAYEFDNSVFDYEEAKLFDISHAGAQIIISDGTENTIKSSKIGEKDGSAIHTSVSLLISGETKGDGILNINSKRKGIETEKHLFINGGKIRISTEDDAIKTKSSNDCMLIIRGGKILINSGLGNHGVEINSGGYVLLDGGEIISASNPHLITTEASKETIVNGGSVFSLGSFMDKISSLSVQPSMKLIFDSEIEPSSMITIKDSDGYELISYCANSADFFSGERRSYIFAVVSLPWFKLKGVYHLFLNGVQLGYTGNGEENEPALTNSLDSSKVIKTDFILNSFSTNFSGIKKAY